MFLSSSNIMELISTRRLFLGDNDQTTLPPACSILALGSLTDFIDGNVQGFGDLTVGKDFHSTPFLTSFAATMESTVISLTGGNHLKLFKRYDGEDSRLKTLVKPRLGRRRCRGIWPPSKPGLTPDPLLALKPFVPAACGFAMSTARSAAEALLLLG
jgi:hypothetical protein